MKSDREKLFEAVDKFSEVMKERLLQKQKQGYRGWDDKNINSYSIPTNLMLKANIVYTTINYFNKNNLKKKMLVDIANFAMFIWLKISK